MRALRKAMPAEARARAAAAISSKIVARKISGTCAVYLASPDEIDLSAAIRDLLARGVAVAAPRWDGASYCLARVRGLSAGDLRKGPMGILEPLDPCPVAPADVSVWLVPGLAFTRDGRRLGYGGGWYDRLMAAADGRAERIGIAYAFQILDGLPDEPHDIRLTSVVDDGATGPDSLSTPCQ